MWTQAQLDYINQRWSQLNTLSKDAANKATNYLLLTNSGGAIATLSFLGAVQSIRSQWAPKAALALFIIGLILVGVHAALWVHHIEGLYANWRTNTGRFFRDEIDWETLNAEDDRRSYSVKRLYVAGYASFGCFIAGATVGLLFSSFN